MKAAMGLVLATFAGAAAAGDQYPQGYQDADGYSAQVSYRLEFGGQADATQHVELRLDRTRAQAWGAPSLLKLTLGAQGVERAAVAGLDLRRAAISAGQQEGTGFFGSLSPAQWVALGFTVIVFGTVAADAADTIEDPSGTGSGSGGG